MTAIYCCNDLKSGQPGQAQKCRHSSLGWKDELVRCRVSWFQVTAMLPAHAFCQAVQQAPVPDGQCEA